MLCLEYDRAADALHAMLLAVFLIPNMTLALLELQAFPRLRATQHTQQEQL